MWISGRKRCTDTSSTPGQISYLLSSGQRFHVCWDLMLCVFHLSQTSVYSVLLPSLIFPSSESILYLFSPSPASRCPLAVNSVLHTPAQSYRRWGGEERGGEGWGRTQEQRCGAVRWNRPAVSISPREEGDEDRRCYDPDRILRFSVCLFVYVGAACSVCGRGPKPGSLTYQRHLIDRAHLYHITSSTNTIRTRASHQFGASS